VERALRPIPIDLGLREMMGYARIKQHRTIHGIWAALTHPVIVSQAALADGIASTA